MNVILVDMNYEQVEEEYGDAIRRVAASYAPPGAERDDLEQEIALAIYEALPKFRDESSIKTYIYRIAQNCGIDRIRKKRVDRVELEQGRTPDLDGTSPEEHAVRRDQYERLAAGVRQLPLKLRQPLVLRLEELTYDEIADVLGISNSNVGVRIHRAKAALKEMLEEAQ
ncbi:MAG: RNA polymerase sigma factor [Myxococcota bacterium]